MIDMVKLDVRGLQKELTAAGKQLEDGIAFATRRATQYGFERLLERNPHLTGFSKSRWNVSIAGSSTIGMHGGSWHSVRRDPNAQYPLPPTPDYASIRWNSRVAISNDAPYIMKIEHHHRNAAYFIKLTTWEMSQKLESETARIGTRAYINRGI